MPMPEKIAQLVETFRQNEAAYRSGQYNETLVRRDFIDPLFASLGWDMNNEQGYAHAYRDVIHEDAIDIDGAKRAPDYCFRIGGVRKFFLEAKKPAVNVRDDLAPAYQLRRYAWSAKLPLSILTDFEEFAVYDCRTKPSPADKSSAHRVMYCRYTDYEKHWDDIAARFSKEAILKGAFDKYAESTTGKRGTATVDAAFLAEIEAWRDALARNIALRNPHIDQRGLNDAVQRTIDRIIFLRLCEDRGIEDYGRLKKLAAGKDIYDELKVAFQQADDRYNSGLFHFHMEKGRTGYDSVSLGLSLDDKVLKPILGRLYYPDSPYEFSVLPADILGQVYEQFLGKVIRLTPGHQAKVEEKPEVRKAGGVYYTPTYIVDYIVQNTVGKLLEGKTPDDIDGSRPGTAPLRVLDPACGSGSFLIVAYQFLLDWHLKAYLAGKPETLCRGKNPKLRQCAQNDYALTVPERKRILLKHIYGVDIDPQAVEVTKLSLLLKVLEGETAETLGLKNGMFHERALPDLDNNIKCGNSLISPDFYHGQQTDAFDAEEMFRINAFDWKHEFPFIVKDGGFDAVVGNPPYLNIDDVWGKKDPRLRAIKNSYPEIYNDKTDILFYFLVKAAQLSRLNVGFIVSRAFLEAYKADKLRGWLAANTALREIVDFQNYYVFKGVGITTSILIYQVGAPPTTVTVRQFIDARLSNPASTPIEDPTRFIVHEIPQASLSSRSWSFVATDVMALNAKVDGVGMSLGDILLIGQGMQTGCNGVFGDRTVEDLRQWRIPEKLCFLRASNSDIQRYTIRDRFEYLLYLEDVPHFEKLPARLQEYLTENQASLKARAAYQRGNCLWWRYTWPLHKEWYSRPKILCPYLATRNRFALDLDQRYIGLTDTTVLVDNGQPENLKYVLGLLNSRLLTFRFRSIGKLKSGGILEYFWNSVSRLSIKRIDFESPKDVVHHDRMVALVERMLSLHKQLPQATTEHERKLLQRQITSTDQEIDRLVYALYGLTPEEIAIVEGAG